jgi:hypothetical protein
VPKGLTKMALQYAQELDDKENFYSIHSLKEGEVGRVILGCSTSHMRQLVSNGEQMAFVGHEAQAKTLTTWFNEVCQKTAGGLGISMNVIEGTEIVKNEPHSCGQIEHMDAFGGVWNVFAPLVDSPGTCVKSQVYQDYPLNIGPRSTIPQNWSTIPDLNIKWKVGDLFFMRSNAIHAGPQNGDTRRYVLFGAETSKYPSEHSDTLVVTEEEFFSHKQNMHKK